MTTARSASPLRTRWMPRCKWVAVALALALLASGCVVEGTDPSFGDKGITTTEVSGTNRGDMVRDLAVGSDGRIVAVGLVDCYQCSAPGVGVVRYNADGHLDRNFNGTGKRVLGFDPDNRGDDYANAVALQPDGKILVGGHAPANGYGLVRLNVTGTLDASFASGGRVTDLPARDVDDIAVQTDGKIVVVGYDNGVFVARYTPTGQRDTAFGTGGVVHTSPRNDCFQVQPGVAVQPDGKILVGGNTGDGDCTHPAQLALARYNGNNGNIDPTFGQGGNVTTPVRPASAPGPFFTGLGLQPDGNIVVAGADAGNSELVRYDTFGTLDRSFGGTGIVVAPDRVSGLIDAVAVRPTDGKIITAGSDGMHMIVVYWNADGTYAPPVFTQVRQDSEAYALAVQPDGKIVAAGASLSWGWHYSTNYIPASNYEDFAVVRYPAQRGTPTIVNPSAGQPSKPVEAYAPLVHLYPSEQYKPMSASVFLQNASLYWSMGLCGPDPTPGGAPPNPISLGHGIYGHTTLAPTSSDPCAQDDAHVVFSDALTRPDADGNGLSSGEGFFLDLADGARGGTGTSAPVYYEYNDEHFIAYWFFYGYNAGGVPATGSEDFAPNVDNHEGDWENITVRLNCNDEAIGVDYRAHGNDHIDDWPHREATPNDPGSSSETLQPTGGTHPITYSALGTHASYATDGLHDVGGLAGFFGATDFTTSSSNPNETWHTENNLIALSAQPWYGYGGAWGPSTSDTFGNIYWGPEAPHHPDKKAAPDDWYGPCVP